ncbi:flagellar basal-body MS-ring/collar protein FliF [Bacillus sp. SM2101]|uniref:flagellar basal-body MS-ring/collar protein FliF n=1 Tax=Bacillus sp. SM2101 TaxID=2805366 RepID=UPI001BDF32AB|nr:flagellar basal-body MS-ring/collar protein FliF [Bacillus sp. SM2101]
MNETMNKYKEKLSQFWNARSKTQKGGMIGAIALFGIVIVIILFLANNTSLQPLYVNLSPQETGQIKATLDSRGIESTVADNGTSILVPTEIVDTLMVELAAEGIPESGSFDYGDFGNNSGLGTTENEFNMLKLDATQNELARLIEGIDGVDDAKVMINLPQPTLFVNEVGEEASASIVLQTKLGYKFDQENVRALYHLVSKSVPNLPTDNIVIMNQNFEYFDLNKENNFSDGAIIANQLEIKREVERDIQRQVQQMLGMMMGQDKVVVSVTADLDFTKENRIENRVEATTDDNEGIAISAKTIRETYSGEGAQAGGIPAGDNDLTTLQSSANNENAGEYERIEETINSEVDRITKEIVESPYKVRDLGIQVMVEPPVASGDTTAVPKDDIQDILSSIVRTSIVLDDGDKLTVDDAKDKVVVHIAQFNGKPVFSAPSKPLIPPWIYIVGAILLAIIILLVALLLYNRSRATEEIDMTDQSKIFLPDVNDEKETETNVRRKQLEKMAKDKPDDFAKLLRSWLAED